MSYTLRKVTTFIVLHCSATKANQDFDAETIRGWHKAQGWIDIGYHYVIKRDGTLETGRPENTVGSHVKGHNSDSLGICLIGGVNDQMKPDANFTEAQNKTLKELLEVMSKRYPHAKVLGHHDLDSGKACPSFSVKTYLDEHKFVTAIKG